MRNALYLTLALALGSSPALSAPKCDAAKGYSATFDGRRTFTWRADALEQSRAHIQVNPAYTKLIVDADRSLTRGPWSVTDKTRTPPSGDKHDYMSIAPYFWPDPSKPDGMPYVNRDGEVNPERATEAFDRSRLGAMGSAVESLGLAYYYTGDKRYAERAALTLRTWFLAPETRMNPHLEFAQGVPGATPGRPYGIIDSAQFLTVIEAIGLIEPSGALSSSELTGLRQWFGDYVTWLQTSKNGIAEGETINNHAIWYDLQVAQFALFAGKPDIAKSVISAFTEKRIKVQFMPDGTLPRELARTRSFHYAMWTLHAAYDLATLGECVGVDLWSWQDADGRGLKSATAFAASYAGREKDWTWQEIDMNTQDLYDALLRAARGYNDPRLSEKAMLYRDRHAAARTNLFTPPLPSKAR